MKLPAGHITADELPDVVCRVCHCTLDVGTTYEGDTLIDFHFKHPPATGVLGFPEHDPEPVAPSPDIERVGICDFCSETQPAWIYMASNFEVHFDSMNTVETSVGAWAACERCHTLIEAENYRELCERALRRQLKLIPGGTPSAALMFKLRKYIKGLHLRFKDNRIGSAIQGDF